jgi:hypothetical protein
VRAPEDWAVHCYVSDFGNVEFTRGLTVAAFMPLGPKGKRWTKLAKENERRLRDMVRMVYEAGGSGPWLFDGIYLTPKFR